MSDRFDPRDLFRGHRKALTLRTQTSTKVDLVAVFIVWAVPVGAGVVAWAADFPIISPDGLLAGLALLSGGLLATFALVATWRERLGAREHLYKDSEESDRESLDEAVTHVLVASVWSVIGVVAIVLAQGIKPEANGSLVGIDCGIVVTIVLHVAILFALVIFKLYDSYLYVNKVSPRLSGGVKE